jgi:hypothetical protein
MVSNRSKTRYRQFIIAGCFVGAMVFGFLNIANASYTLINDYYNDTDNVSIENHTIYPTNNTGDVYRKLNINSILSYAEISTNTFKYGCYYNTYANLEYPRYYITLPRIASQTNILTYNWTALSMYPDTTAANYCATVIIRGSHTSPDSLGSSASGYAFAMATVGGFNKATLKLFRVDAGVYTQVAKWEPYITETSAHWYGVSVTDNGQSLTARCELETSNPTTIRFVYITTTYNDQKEVMSSGGHASGSHDTYLGDLWIYEPTAPIITNTYRKRRFTNWNWWGIK